MHPFAEAREECAQGENEPLVQTSHPAPHVKRSFAFGKAECKRILALAGPLVIQNVFGYSLSIVSAIAVGHLNNPTILSSVVLAGSIYNLTGLSIVVGLSAGMDTIAGQAYGAKNYRMLGTVLQRATLVCWAACVPILLFYMHAAQILMMLGQSEEIAKGAARYLGIAGFTLLFSVVSTNNNRYLVTQQVVEPGMVCTAITSLLCPLYNWLLIYKFNMGLDGAAYAYVASNATFTILLAAYTAWRDMKMYREEPQLCTWPGFTWGAFEGWFQYLRYGGPAAAMICCEWWLFELVILLAGALPNADVAVAVMGILFNLIAIAYMLPMSLGSACNTCIANALGAGDGVVAQRFCSAGFCMSVASQTCLASSMWIFGRPLVSVFTPAPTVISLAMTAVPIVALATVGDGFNALLGGVLRACGRQAWGAGLNLFSYWCIGLPLTLLLGFKLHLTVVGFWCGLAVGSAVQAVAQMIVLARIDWNMEVKRAKSLVDEPSDSKAETSCLLPRENADGANGNYHTAANGHHTTVVIPDGAASSLLPRNSFEVGLPGESDAHKDR